MNRDERFMENKACQEGELGVYELLLCFCACSVHTHSYKTQLQDRDEGGLLTGKTHMLYNLSFHADLTFR